MTTLTVQIPEDKLEQVRSFLHGLGIREDQYQERAGWQVPQWHMDDVRQARAETMPEDYIPLDEFLKEWESE